MFGAEWQRDLVERHQHDLIDRYDMVLCTDTDEIVAPDRRCGDLGDQLDRLDQDFVTCQECITDPVEFREWFHRDGCGGGPIEPERIPAPWRDVV